jgi:allantoin racemase
MPEDELRYREKVANSISRKNTNISVIEVGEGPLSIESTIEEIMALGPLLKKILELSEDKRYAAIIIGCAGDPGLRAARELVDIPIIGPAESSYYFACMLADRFSILSTRCSEDGLRARLREMILEQKVASIEIIETAIADMWGENREIVTKQMKEGVERGKIKGAGGVVLGCMSLAFLMVDDILEQKTGIPIVNPLKTAIKTAEMFVDLEAKHSRISYPPADIKKLRKTVFSQ